MPDYQLDYDVQLNLARAAVLDEWEKLAQQRAEGYPEEFADRFARLALDAAGLRDMIEWQRKTIETINGTITTDVINAAGHFEFDLGKLYDALRAQAVEYESLKRQLTMPPPGWDVFGKHAGVRNLDGSDVRLEFWGDEGGVPIWERVRTGS